MGWPGRKDYEYPSEYQGIATIRQHQFFADAVKSEISEREVKEKALTAKLTEEVKKELNEKYKDEL